MHILGQICGIISTAASIVMPLYKKKWQMLVNTLLINLLIALNLLLIGELGPGAILCLLAAVQCCFSLWHTHRGTGASKAETVIFCALYLVLGFLGLIATPGFRWELSWHNARELLPIVGSLLSMTFVFIRDEQRARWFLLATCLVWALYTGLVGASSFFAQAASAVITVIALIRYHAGSAC